MMLISSCNCIHMSLCGRPNGCCLSVRLSISLYHTNT